MTERERLFREQIDRECEKHSVTLSFDEVYILLALLRKGDTNEALEKTYMAEGNERVAQEMKIRSHECTTTAFLLVEEIARRKHPEGEIL